MADEMTQVEGAWPKIRWMSPTTLVEVARGLPIVLTPDDDRAMLTRGPDGLLSNVKPREGWPARIVLAVNSYEPMREALESARAALEGWKSCPAAGLDGRESCPGVESALEKVAFGLRASDPPSESPEET